MKISDDSIFMALISGVVFLFLLSAAMSREASCGHDMWDSGNSLEFSNGIDY